MSFHEIGLYGVVAEKKPRVTTAVGLPFGVVTHAVYGVATDLVRRAIRKAI